jgi:DNA-binding SARP family transcriptional activator
VHANSGDWASGQRATYLLLGSPAVRTPTGLIPVRGRLQATLFSILALDIGHPVASERLIDAMWQHDPPGDAVNALQSQVSRLRLVVGAPAIQFTAGRYELDGSGLVDVHVFERLLGRARARFAAGDFTAASTVAGQALVLWRGSPFPDLQDAGLAKVESVLFDELRLQALVLRIECDLAQRHEGSAIIALRQLTTSHPLREDLWGLLVLALYRSGRPADALGAYRLARTALVDELGIEPSPQLRELERAVLRHDPALSGPPHACPAHVHGEGPPRPTRSGSDQVDLGARAVVREPFHRQG